MPTWAKLEEARIRPGTAAPGCTFNWVFVDPATQTYYIGHAGHCTGNADNEENPENGMGTRIGSAGWQDGEDWGTVVFDSDNRTMQDKFGIEDRVDFSLIQLDEGVNLITHPQMMGYDAPVGFKHCNETSTGDLIGWHGYGMVFGDNDVTRKREGVLAVCDDRDYGAYTNAIFGDSGSAVVHVESRMAMGIVSRLGAETSPPTELTGATIPYILTELAKHPSFGNIHLATSDGGFVGLNSEAESNG